jgi:serine protease
VTFRPPPHLVLATLLLTAGFLPRSAHALPIAPRRPDRAPSCVPDELLVKFKSGISSAAAVKLIQARGGTLVKTLTPDGLVEVRIPRGTTLSQAFDRFDGRPEVEYVTVNGRTGASFAPDDSLFQEFDLTWNLENVGAPAAWDVVTGKPDVVLAIIDSGVAFEDRAIPDYELPFVKPGSTMYRQSPELPGPFLAGRDFVNSDDHPDDDCGHGTFVATIAAGQANNVAGAAGIAWGVTILPIKVLHHNQSGDMGAIVQGIRYAGDQGADVANLSFAFAPRGLLLDSGLDKKFVRDFFRPLEDAVRYAQSRGVVLVAEAGDFAYPELSFPAGLPGVISVSATNVDDRIASYSSFGDGLDFAAPGGDFTDRNDDHFQDLLAELSIKPFRSSGSLCAPDSFNIFFSFGTSGATPHVSGAVALLMSQGIRSQGRIEEILRDTAIDPFGNARGNDPVYGAGIIRVDKAVRLAARAGRVTGVTERHALDARVVSRNPARGGAALAVRTRTLGPVTVGVYDVRGHLVRTVADGVYPAGERTLQWDGKDDRGGSVGSGVYFFRIVTPDGVEQRKVAVLR